MNSPNQKTAGAHHDDRDQSKQTLCEFQVGREEAGFPARFLIRTVGDAARLLAGACPSFPGRKLTTPQWKDAGALWWTFRKIQSPSAVAFAARTSCGPSASGRQS